MTSLQRIDTDALKQDRPIADVVARYRQATGFALDPAQASFGGDDPRQTFVHDRRRLGASVPFGLRGMSPLRRVG